MAKPNTALNVVWWLWLVPAVGALVVPVEFVVSVAIRGWEDVGFVFVIGMFATVFSFPPFLVLSPLYIFMFWRKKEQGVTLSRRFWVPIYGTALLVVVWAAMVLRALSNN